MKLSAFEKVIRKVIREEIDYALRREIALLKEELVSPNKDLQIKELKNEPAPEEFRQKLREQFTPQSFSQDSTLNSLLNETAESSYNTPQPQHNPHDPVNQFLSKDYSQLMKAIDKKKNFRP
tara:strand:- start:2633 stop:2998 length:366 start_codon:yes stop_codon:yes gene_type:complete